MADIKINGATPSGFYYGGAAASAVYYGSTKLWEPAPAGAVIGGKTYPTVTMPDGHEWLALNLDYAWSGLSVPTSSATTSSSPQAVYYNYDESAYGWNGTKYGLLYNGIAVRYLENNKNTLCPGWHVPSNSEYGALLTAIGSGAAGKLKSTSGWEDLNGTDIYGFGVVPAGQFSDAGFGIEFREIYNTGYLWTNPSSASATSSNAKFWQDSSNNYTYSQGYSLTASHFSIRLIKDY